jgi:hypothetical protein
VTGDSGLNVTDFGVDRNGRSRCRNGDATIADAMLDRLMQRHHRFTLTGESLRQKSKTAKQEKNPDPS